MNSEFDTQSEISFNNRQKDLQSLYSDFKSVINQMKSIYEPTFNEEISSLENEDLINDHKNELKVILDEIRFLKSEIFGIKADLKIYSSKNNNQNIINLINKINNIISILDSQKIRTESLLNVDFY